MVQFIDLNILPAKLCLKNLFYLHQKTLDVSQTIHTSILNKQNLTHWAIQIPLNGCLLVGSPTLDIYIHIYIDYDHKATIFPQTHTYKHTHLLIQCGGCWKMAKLN